MDGADFWVCPARHEHEALVVYGQTEEAGFIWLTMLLGIWQKAHCDVVQSGLFVAVANLYHGENLYKIAYLDIVERFHIMTYLLFILAQNVMSAESPWVSSFFVVRCFSLNVSSYHAAAKMELYFVM